MSSNESTLNQYHEEVSKWSRRVCQWLKDAPLPLIEANVHVVVLKFEHDKAVVEAYRFAETAHEVVPLPLSTNYFTKNDKGEFEYWRYGSTHDRLIRGRLAGPIFRYVPPDDVSKTVGLFPPKSGK